MSSWGFNGSGSGGYSGSRGASTVGGTVSNGATSVGASFSHAGSIGGPGHVGGGVSASHNVTNSTSVNAQASHFQGNTSVTAGVTHKF